MHCTFFLNTWFNVHVHAHNMYMDMYKCAQQLFVKFVLTLAHPSSLVSKSLYTYNDVKMRRPFETIQNFHFQKCPLVLYTHGDTIWTVLVASCTTIQIHSNGFRGSIDSPVRSIQTRFCISCTTIWKDPNKVLYNYCKTGNFRATFIFALSA